MDDAPERVSEAVAEFLLRFKIKKKKKERKEYVSTKMRDLSIVLLKISYCYNIYFLE